jgi:hypothetical protein
MKEFLKIMTGSYAPRPAAISGGWPIATYDGVGLAAFT